ncbi:hypothetical protein RRG08_039962 [Elysia crispata]|uniref:Uncharacterized protein n=1 Tax=Elysia crispata TaxID=231223 RepID=A0AAE0Z991_9GAST|nr:hypothetical protein RRG08_039962 [Elysia crispata]
MVEKKKSSGERNREFLNSRTGSLTSGCAAVQTREGGRERPGAGLLGLRPAADRAGYPLDVTASARGDAGYSEVTSRRLSIELGRQLQPWTCGGLYDREIEILFAVNILHCSVCRIEDWFHLTDIEFCEWLVALARCHTMGPSLTLTAVEINRHTGEGSVGLGEQHAVGNNVGCQPAVVDLGLRRSGHHVTSERCLQILFTSHRLIALSGNLQTTWSLLSETSLRNEDLSDLLDLPDLSDLNLPDLPDLPDLSDLNLSDIPDIPDFSDLNLSDTTDLLDLLDLLDLSDLDLDLLDLPDLSDLVLPELLDLPDLSDLNLSDIPDLPGFSDLNLSDIPHLPGFSDLNLSDIPDLPGFSDLNLSDIPDLPGFSDLNLSDIPDLPGFSDLNLSDIPDLPGFSDLNLSDIPDLPGFSDFNLSDIPDLPDLSDLDLPDLLDLSDLDLLDVSDLPDLPDRHLTKK